MSEQIAEFEIDGKRYRMLCQEGEPWGDEIAWSSCKVPQFFVDAINKAFSDLASLIDRAPFDLAWARSVLPDGNKTGSRFYSYERQIYISSETDAKHNDTGRFLLIVDDEGTEVEMKTRGQFLALCVGLGLLGGPSNG
jgi:hypothetical protein